MTQKKKKSPNYKSAILEFLKKKRGRSYRRKELSRALDVQKPTYHLFRDALNELLRDGKVSRMRGGKYAIGEGLSVVSGTLQMTRKGFGFVTVENEPEDYFISAGNILNAFDGDTVKIQVLTDRRGRSKEGRIVEVVERARSRFVGTFHKSDYYCFVAPDNAKINRDFYVADEDTAGAVHGQKVVVRLEHWDPRQQNPEGEVVDILGFPDEAGVDVSSVMMEFGLPLEFPARIEAEAAKIKPRLTKKELGNRLDLRDEMIFTIDPPDAKDFDDAISLRNLENGNIELGVHIADVSHYVLPNTELDKEALERGTSVYLVDRVIPMLPEYLSNKLCSLQPNVDRLTYSCIMELNAAGTVVEHTIRKSVIHSKRRFTYGEVQEIVNDKSSSDELAPLLNQMMALSKRLRQIRIDSGSIDFSTPEVRFKLDESGQPVDIVQIEHLDSHQMIEEFMLLANQTVTKHVAAKAVNGKIDPFIYRVHEAPDRDKLERFENFLKALGYKIQLKRNMSPAEFQTVLKSVTGGPDDTIVKEVALRTMMKAVYSPQNKGHFGLAFDHYTHFTSPIRRYPDLIVHRLLAEYDEPVSGERKRQLKKDLKKISDKTSQKERNALEAERESIKIKQVEWIAQHRQEVFNGIISGVTAYGIFVEVQPYLIEGMVRLEDIKDDYYIYDERTFTLVGRDTGRTLRLADPVKVRVAAINREHHTVDFLLEN